MHDRFLIHKGDSNRHTGTDVPLSPQAQSQNACGLDSQRDTDEEESLYAQDDDALMQIEEYGLEALFAENEHPGTNEPIVDDGVETLNTSGTTPEDRASDIPCIGDGPVSTTQDDAATVPQTNRTAQKSRCNRQKRYRPYCTTVSGQVYNWW